MDYLPVLIICFLVKLFCAQQDFLIAKSLNQFFHFPSASVVVTQRNAATLKPFLKSVQGKIYEIEMAEDVMNVAETLVSKPNMMISLLADDDITIAFLSAAYDANNSIFSEIFWFVKVKDLNRIIESVKHVLSFDSNLYLFQNLNINKTKIVEAYSIKQGQDYEMVQRNDFGIWENGELTIGQPNKWERRTDLFGAKLR